MVRFNWAIRGLVLALTLACGTSSLAQLYIPNKLFGAMYTDYGNMPSTTINHPFFENITPFPTEYILEETNITGAFPPSGEEGGQFERNEHQIRFATNGETSNGQATGHKFQRREAWDFAFDLKIESLNVNVRKEAGLYFKSNVGNALFTAVSNDTFYGTEPGTIGTIFANVIPEFSFSSTGILGDYNGNGTVDAADYTIWRDTYGSTTDFRANGSNEGESLDRIDEADYAVWKQNFGMSAGGGVRYELGDTLRMRVIYTPPELADMELPDVENDPNVTAPGTMEYIISLNGGTAVSSGELVFENTWQGIPKDTLIMLRVQNVGTAAVINDSSKVTFNNFDFNGDLPGSGLPGAGALLVGGVVPEPSSLLLVAIMLSLVGCGRRRIVC